MPIGRIFGAQTTPRRQRSKSECAALTLSFDRNNSDGKASLKRQKSPEITTDTQDVSKFYRFTCKMFIFRNVYFVPHNIPYKVLNFQRFDYTTCCRRHSKRHTIVFIVFLFPVLMKFY